MQFSSKTVIAPLEVRHPYAMPFSPNDRDCFGNGGRWLRRPHPPSSLLPRLKKLHTTIGPLYCLDQPSAMARDGIGLAARNGSFGRNLVLLRVIPLMVKPGNNRRAAPIYLDSRHLIPSKTHSSPGVAFQVKTNSCLSGNSLTNKVGIFFLFSFSFVNCFTVIHL